MKILFDLTPIYDHLTGIERYNINITKEIIKYHSEEEYILIFKNEVHNSFKNEVKLANVKEIIIPGCNKLVFIQWRLYQVVKEINADYYVFLSFTSPVLFKKQKLINAIHDLTCWDCPESIPAKMKYYYRYTYRIAAKRSWKLITVSKFSQRRLCDRYNLSKECVPVIYDGLTDIFSEKPHTNAKLKQKYNLPEKYILSLSTIEPRKNLQLLIRIYKEMIEEGEKLPDLVLAGRQGWKLEDIISGIKDEIKQKIHFTGFIDDNDLAQIYREADLFVFPSKYEGFGLPIIEAMSQGTLVLSSDSASLPEIMKGAGILFESDNDNSLKQSLLKCLRMSKEQKVIEITMGKEVSKQYNWHTEAEKLYNILSLGKEEL